MEDLKKLKQVRSLIKEVEQYNLKTSKLYDRLIKQDYPNSVIAKRYNGIGSELYMSENVRHLTDEVFELILPAVMIHDVDYSGSNKSAELFNAANDRFYINMKILINKKISWWRFIKRYSFFAAARVFKELVDSKLGKESFLTG